MRVVAIIQARMSSTRLPGKVLKDLGGETVLARVVNRTRRAALVDEIVVATSVLPADDDIARECEALKVACFRGDELDVLDRYYRAAQEFAADVIVRITSDCPLIDPDLIDATVRSRFDQKADYASNALVRSYPRGLDVEAFTADALARAWSSATEKYQRIHVTPYLYETPKSLKVISTAGEIDHSQYRWTLDTPEDLELIRAIYKHFGNRDNMRWLDVLHLMETQPELAALNSHVRQKAMREG
ncbi:MAG TPA: glycosyltransferase family protein [Terriglobales bacterium]|jgi:spore coat polysaccharide biosynthesis protein SpsF|nr:glycosyltransferase family protein [Terriglobales bacterium]